MGSKEEKKLAKKLAREQLLIKIRKDTLDREAALDETTLKKIKEKWFNTLIETRVPEIKDNIKQIFFYMEKLVEAENFRKAEFEEERKELEEECNLLYKGHNSALEMLCDVYERRIQDLRHFYTDMITEKKTEAEAEFKAINDHEEDAQEKLQTMLHLMNDNKEKKEEAMNYAMFLKIDDDKSKNLEIFDNLHTKMEKKMEKRWGEITNVLTTYDKNTSTRRKEYLLLKAKDDSDSRIISQQMKKTQMLFEQYEELKKCLDGCYVSKEMFNLIEDMKEERNQFFQTFKKLKALVAEELKGDDLNLKNLTKSSGDVINDLRQLCQKGEQILTLYRICLRLETQSEKVFPVGYSFKMSKHAPEHSKNQKTNKAVKQKEEILSNEDTAFNAQDFSILNNFWKKIGQVKLSKMALKKCTENMQKENSLLKRLLATYLKEFSRETERGRSTG